jgi:hypothetical protein
MYCVTIAPRCCSTMKMDGVMAIVPLAMPYSSQHTLMEARLIY